MSIRNLGNSGSTPPHVDTLPPSTPLVQSQGVPTDLGSSATTTLPRPPLERNDGQRNLLAETPTGTVENPNVTITKITDPNTGNVVYSKPTPDSATTATTTANSTNLHQPNDTPDAPNTPQGMSWQKKALIGGATVATVAAGSGAYSVSGNGGTPPPGSSVAPTAPVNMASQSPEAPLFSPHGMLDSPTAQTQQQGGGMGGGGLMPPQQPQGHIVNSGQFDGAANTALTGPMYNNSMPIGNIQGIGGGIGGTFGTSSFSSPLMATGGLTTPMGLSGLPMGAVGMGL